MLGWCLLSVPTVLLAQGVNSSPLTIIAKSLMGILLGPLLEALSLWKPEPLNL